MIQSRRNRAMALVIATLLMSLLVGGCIGMPQPGESLPPTTVPGGDEDIRPVAGLGRLRGPWHAEPFVPDPAIVAAADQECRRGGFGRALAPDQRLRVADVRGASRLTIVYASDDSGYAVCELEMLADGGLTQTGGAMSAGGGPAVAIGPDEAIPRGGGGTHGPEGEAWYSVHGELGVGVAQVRARSRGRVAVAAVADGWFSAWWPGSDRDLVIEAFAPDGSKLGEAPW